MPARGSAVSVPRREAGAVPPAGLLLSHLPLSWAKTQAGEVSPLPTHLQRGPGSQSVRGSGPGWEGQSESFDSHRSTERGCGCWPGAGTEGGCVEGHSAAPWRLLAGELWRLVYLVWRLMTLPGSQTLKALPLGWTSYTLWGAGASFWARFGDLGRAGPRLAFSRVSRLPLWGLSVGWGLSSVSGGAHPAATLRLPLCGPASPGSLCAHLLCLLCLRSHCPWQPAVL